MISKNGGEFGGKNIVQKIIQLVSGKMVNVMVWIYLFMFFWYIQKFGTILAINIRQIKIFIKTI